MYKTMFVLLSVPKFINTDVNPISENTNTANGYEVWTIDIEDLDGDANPTTEIIETDGAFTISNDKIVTTEDFDFEIKQNYTITIKWVPSFV